MPRFSIDQVVAATSAVAKAGGVVTWDVPLKREGRIAPPFLDQLTAVGKALGPASGLLK